MQLPPCAKSGKTAEECGDVLLANVNKSMGIILDAIHEANPSMRVVGFGYDIMFGGLGCSLLTHEFFPQCYKGHPLGGNRCFVRFKKGHRYVVCASYHVHFPLIPTRKRRRAFLHTFIFPSQNTQFIRLQAVWEDFAAKRDYVDSINLLGTTQVAGDVPHAAIGKPNLVRRGGVVAN